MAKRIYLVAVIRNGKPSLDNVYEAYDSREKAEKWIFDTAKTFADRRVKKSEKMKCDYDVTDDKGNFIHTLRIVEMWLR